MQEIIINEELRTLLPRLSDDEFAGLEASILKDGCLADLVVWNGILIDGHHRYEICRKHHITFGVKNLIVDDLESAKYWAWNNQDKRRNLAPYQRAEIAMRLKEAVAARAKDRQRAAGGDHTNASEKALTQLVAEPLVAKETRQELAEIAKMSHATLRRAEYIAEHADEETKNKLRRGEKGITIAGEYHRLKGEERNETAVSVDTSTAEPEKTLQEEDITAEETPNTVITSLFPDEKPGFPPGSPEEEKYSSKTQLKPIPRNRPDILVANLISFFPKEFVPNTAREVFRQLHDRYGKEVTKPLATELYKTYVRK